MPSLPPPGSIPTTYRGTRFRSKLEARWAATFDTLGWYWEYEPVTLDLGHGIRYTCDFWLREQDCWLEVKGPIERVDKLNRLQQASAGSALVVIARPAGPGGMADWAPIGMDAHACLDIYDCANCKRSSFALTPSFRDFDTPYTEWRCRRCDAPDALIPDSRRSPASVIESARRNHGESYTDHFYRGLPFATLRRSGAA